MILSTSLTPWSCGHSAKFPEKMFSCSQCPKKFVILMRFDRHKKDHQSGKIVIKRKKEIHQEKQTWTCEHCGKLAKNYSTLQLHKLIHNEPTKKCDKCEKSFKTRGDLKKHQRVHSDKKSYVCSLCSKSFTQPSSLRLHKVVHTGEKLFSCTFCSKSFTQRGALNLHKRIHTGERPFKCGKCGKNIQKHAVCEGARKNSPSI